MKIFDVTEVSQSQLDSNAWNAKYSFNYVQTFSRLSFHFISFKIEKDLETIKKWERERDGDGERPV